MSLTGKPPNIHTSRPLARSADPLPTVCCLLSTVYCLLSTDVTPRLQCTLMSTVAFTPPSPGAWELERTHATRRLCRFSWDVFPESMVRGFGDATREYGALLDYIELAIIDGFLYSAPRPVGAPKGAKGPPPKPIFKLLVLFHPEIRRRVRRAEEVFQTKKWRQELKWWDEEVKPKIAAEAKELLAEDLSGCRNGSLAAH